MQMQKPKFYFLVKLIQLETLLKYPLVLSRFCIVDQRPKRMRMRTDKVCHPPEFEEKTSEKRTRKRWIKRKSKGTNPY